MYDKVVAMGARRWWWEILRVGPLLVSAVACVDTGNELNDSASSGAGPVMAASASMGDTSSTADSTSAPAASPIMTMPGDGGSTPTGESPGAGTATGVSAPADASAGEGTGVSVITPPSGSADAAAAPTNTNPNPGVAATGDPVAGMAMAEAPPAIAPMLASIAGTRAAAGCFSYTEPEGGMCGAHFCGVTVDELGAALDPNNLCSTDPQVICEGAAAAVVADCAREIGPLHLDILFNPDTAQRDEGLSTVVAPEVRACVQEDPAVGDLAVGCVDCFIEVALCAAVNCVGECLAGDSEACDQCRIENNCDQSLFGCAGLPNPF